MNRINFLIIINIFIKKIFFHRLNHYKLKELELNFLNTNFEDFNKLKNIYMKILHNYDYKNLSKEYYFNTFDWLGLSKKLGGVENIKHAQKNIFKWQKNHKTIFNKAWEANITAKRLINLMQK